MISQTKVKEARDPGKTRIRKFVFWMPLLFFGALVFASIIAPQSFLRVATAMNDWILAKLSNVFAIGSFIFVLTCIWAAISPLGKIKIGGAEATPLLSRWSWIAITLTTTVAIGILFWATAEPIYHLYNPAGLPYAATSEEAANFAMASLYMHWSFTPYAIYTIPGLTFALCYYNLKKPFSLSSPISVLIGRPMPAIGAQALDGLALLALAFGLSASLGAGILSISGGIDRLSPLSAGPVLTGAVALFIVTAFFISSVSGLHRGIRLLSDINTKIFLGLMLFVLVAGPTWKILSLGGAAFLDYLTSFIPRSLTLSPYDNREWLNSWTVFYFANWMAWAPLAALFLGKIARGYTVRAYIVVNLIIPALFSIFWMIIFGGLAVTTELGEPQVLNQILEAKGPEHVLYAVLDSLPFASILALIIIVISCLSYITAADSNLDVISNLTLKQNTDEDSDAPLSRKISLGFKLIWALAVGFAAWIMTTLSGIDGVKMLSNLGGLPALFIILTFNVVLILLGTIKLKSLKG